MEEKQVDKEKPASEMVQISKKEWQKVQDQLAMLYNVADKGRIQSYEKQHQGKQLLKVKLSVYDGKYIVGWRVVEDSYTYHPTTGQLVGETQTIEVELLDKDNKRSIVKLNGYKKFSDIRYTERVEVSVVSKKEDVSGNWTFDVELPDGRILSLDSRFVN